MKKRIAYFVSPHGYGHAARSAAIMQAMADKACHFEIFSKIPRWFFTSSFSNEVEFGYHSLLTDIGLAQQTSLTEDLPETLRHLDGFLPFATSQIKDLAQLLNKLCCIAVICDIAPMGIAVAKEAGIPSILVENFTWDWIYQNYVQDYPQLEYYISYLQGLFEATDYHIQTEPVCNPHAVDLTTKPVSRKRKTLAAEIRRLLHIPEQAKMIVLTMGGMSWEYSFLELLENQPGLHFVVAGNGVDIERRGNLTLLPKNSSFFHPDLVNACDAVICKIGYSTVAEVYQAGVPFGYLHRQQFRESAVLVEYVKKNMHGISITEAQFQDGSWLSLLPELLSLPRIKRPTLNGKEQAATFINGLLGL